MTFAPPPQALEEQLSAKEMECSRLQTDYSMLKQQYHHDKDVLKKASRQHKDRALQSERTLDSMGGQLEEAVSYHGDHRHVYVSLNGSCDAECGVQQIKVKTCQIYTRNFDQRN